MLVVYHSTEIKSTILIYQELHNWIPYCEKQIQGEQQFYKLNAVGFFTLFFLWNKRYWLKSRTDAVNLGCEDFPVSLIILYAGVFRIFCLKLIMALTVSCVHVGTGERFVFRWAILLSYALLQCHWIVQFLYFLF